MTMATDEQTFTLEEVARRLKLHPDTVRRMITKKQITAVKVGRVYRIRESEINRILNEGTH